ncbi:MAG: 1,4-alpha-glucan branching protein GlgB [Clostridiales bacterium]|jgi:1,4-alpha-glucan branching enzyme|nr:1,4-alpha-glucan branching protein GlgB [Clostridiales bacterium]
MYLTADITELQGLLTATLSDPHHLLGMHEVTIPRAGTGKKRGRKTVPKAPVQALSVRAFIPGAEKIEVLDPADPSYCAALDRVHDDGIFEALLPDRLKWFRYQLRIETPGSRWVSYDPYSFMPVLTEFDLYLFGQGTHYEIYEKLGASPTTVDGVEGVLFAVWAPKASRVSVIGSFNNWDGRRHMMRLLGDVGVWELFVPGLSRYDKYKFEIRTAAGAVIEKSDPFGKFFELRPSSSGLVFDIDGYKWNDGLWMEKRAAEAQGLLNKPLNIYEVHLGSWRRTPEGAFLTYRELAKDLALYVKDMGYTHVELMPVSEYPFDGSWGYQVTGYYAPTSRYGSPHDFMYFVDTMHRNGIGVILDWVPAHFPKDAHGLGRFDGSALFEHEDPRLGEHPDWGTYIFNYGRNEVKNFLIANALFWLDKYHVDGLRVDAVASLLYLDFGKRQGSYVLNSWGGNVNDEAVEFIKHLNSVALKRFPGIMMIAEESTSWSGVSRPLEDGGLGFNLKWNMGWMNDFLTYMAKDPIHRKFHHNNLTFGIVYAYNENFILVMSHDEVVHLKKALVDKMPGDLWRKCANLRVSLAYMYGHPGKKLLFMGGEFGQFAEWSEARSLDWFLLDYPHHRQIKDFVRDLNKLYLKEKALWADDFTSGGFEWIDCDDSDRSILAFIRKTGEPYEDIYITVNFTPNIIDNYRLGLPQGGSYKEILNSDDPRYGGSGIINPGRLKAVKGKAMGRDYYIEMNIPPLGAALFKRLKR